MCLIYAAYFSYMQQIFVMYAVYIQDDSNGHVQNEIRDRGPHTESGKVGYLRSKMHQFLIRALFSDQ